MNVKDAQRTPWIDILILLDCYCLHHRGGFPNILDIVCAIGIGNKGEYLVVSHRDDSGQLVLGGRQWANRAMDC